MESEDDKTLRDYENAKSAYDAAERNLAVARARLRQAEISRDNWWWKLLDRAEKLSPDGRKIAAERQFGPALSSTKRETP
jgi:hypothetical protein